MIFDRRHSNDLNWVEWRLMIITKREGNGGSIPIWESQYRLSYTPALPRKLSQFYAVATHFHTSKVQINLILLICRELSLPIWSGIVLVLAAATFCALHRYNRSINKLSRKFSHIFGVSELLLISCSYLILLLSRKELHFIWVNNFFSRKFIFKIKMFTYEIISSYTFGRILQYINLFQKMKKSMSR